MFPVQSKSIWQCRHIIDLHYFFHDCKNLHDNREPAKMDVTEAAQKESQQLMCFSSMWLIYVRWWNLCYNSGPVGVTGIFYTTSCLLWLHKTKWTIFACAFLQLTRQRASRSTHLWSNRKRRATARFVFLQTFWWTFRRTIGAEKRVLQKLETYFIAISSYRQITANIFLSLRWGYLLIFIDFSQILSAEIVQPPHYNCVRCKIQLLVCC